jgi:hypothetical protein
MAFALAASSVRPWLRPMQAGEGRPSSRSAPLQVRLSACDCNGSPVTRLNWRIEVLTVRLLPQRKHTAVNGAPVLGLALLPDACAVTYRVKGRAAWRRCS